MFFPYFLIRPFLSAFLCPYAVQCFVLESRVKGVYCSLVMPIYLLMNIGFADDRNRVTFEIVGRHYLTLEFEIKERVLKCFAT